VRELEHVISRAALKAVSYGHAAPTSSAWTPPRWTWRPRRCRHRHSPGAALPGAAAGQVSSTFSSLREQVDHVQRNAIEQALGQHQGVWSAAAKSLQIDSSNLHNWRVVWA
jgi:anaerobic nitric oxide reductase transcription regulator